MKDPEFTAVVGNRGQVPAKLRVARRLTPQIADRACKGKCSLPERRDLSEVKSRPFCQPIQQVAQVEDISGNPLGVARASENVATQVFVAGQLVEVRVHVSGVDLVCVARAIGGLVRDGVEQSLHHRVQAPGADVLG